MCSLPNAGYGQGLWSCRKSFGQRYEGPRKQTLGMGIWEKAQAEAPANTKALRHWKEGQDRRAEGGEREEVRAVAKGRITWGLEMVARTTDFEPEK